MQEELDFEVWAQQYEKDNPQMKERIAELENCLKTASEAKKPGLKQRIAFLQSAVRYNENTASFLRERGQKV